MTFPNRIKHQIRSPLVAGTLLLTLAGVLSRLIGFYYRIFLSRRIGAESLGLYHLTFPVLALALSLTSSGIQTALSRFVAQGRQTMRFFAAALALSCSLALLAGVAVHRYSLWLATEYLGDARCQDILRVMSYALLPAAVHACVNGYYYGLKKAAVPSISQLLEQLTRVGGVYLIYLIRMQEGLPLDAVCAMWGIVIGEIFGFLYSVSAMWISRGREPRVDASPALSYPHALRLLCSMAIPLTCNRLLVTLCTSAENMLIPKGLCRYGMSSSEALSVYGVLTGMTLSVILFPNVLTNSLSVLLLPAVSEAKEKGRENAIRRAVKKAVLCGLLLGGFFTVCFLLLGDAIGCAVFRSPLAGSFIRQLSWLCPFMYLSGMLGSILHGLGKAKTVLFISLLSCLIRIVFILSAVPQYGIHAYLWSLLLSQMFAALASLIPLRDYAR